MSVEELRHSWEQWGGGEGGVGKKVPLYCDNGALWEMVKRGGVGGGEGGKGDDTRSIAHQVSPRYPGSPPHCPLLSSWGWGETELGERMREETYRRRSLAGPAEQGLWRNYFLGDGCQWKQTRLLVDW